MSRDVAIKHLWEFWVFSIEFGYIYIYFYTFIAGTDSFQGV